MSVAILAEPGSLDKATKAHRPWPPEWPVLHGLLICRHPLGLLNSWYLPHVPVRHQPPGHLAPRRRNCYDDYYVRLLVLFCPVVLPGFLYLVIFLSLFSLIIILITWYLPIYSVPCLVQVFIALPFPCFFVLSHVVLSGFFPPDLP